MDEEAPGSTPARKSSDIDSETYGLIEDLTRRTSNLEMSLPALLANQQRHGSLLVKIHQSAVSNVEMMRLLSEQMTAHAKQISLRTATLESQMKSVSPPTAATRLGHIAVIVLVVVLGAAWNYATRPKEDVSAKAIDIAAERAVEKAVAKRLPGP